MADHVIIQVRDAVIAKLQANVAAVSGRVYRADEEPQDESMVPYLMVEVGDDAADRMSIGGVGNILEDIQLIVFVHCVVKQIGDAEQAAYNLRRDVEQTLLGSLAGNTLDGTVPQIRRMAGQPRRDMRGDLEVFAAGVQCQITIRHLESQPDSFAA